MSSARTGAVSGCVIWFIVFALLGSCLVPLGMALGGITSVSHFALRTLGPWICPDSTTPQFRTYASTTTDEFGNSQPTTAYVMQCLDAGGAVIKEDPVLYSFLWIGIISAIGLILAGIFAFVLAAPAGVLVAGWKNRNRKPDITESIEPS